MPDHALKEHVNKHMEKHDRVNKVQVAYSYGSKNSAQLLVFLP